MMSETKTDDMVADLLKKSDIQYERQIISIKEVDEALKTASKSGKNNKGRPDFIFKVKDFLIVIENKADIKYHESLDENGLIIEKDKEIKNYAVNGALFYGKHLAKNTTYKNIIAIGVSGYEKRHKITPIFINERLDYTVLDELKSFTYLNEDNIWEYYIRQILKESTNYEKQAKDILKDAQTLHEDLRNYGSIQDKDKPLIVSGILLALREEEYGGFNINNLIGDRYNTDGQKIYEAIKNNLNRSHVAPETKKDKLLSQFSVIKDTVKINEINKTLGKTPLCHYTEFLKKSIFDSIRYTNSSEDYIGRFYGEFMSYSGGDGQTLGIVLTPKHITELFCDLLQVKYSDVIFDIILQRLIQFNYPKSHCA